MSWLGWLIQALFGLSIFEVFHLFDCCFGLWLAGFPFSFAVLGFGYWWTAGITAVLWAYCCCYGNIKKGCLLITRILLLVTRDTNIAPHRLSAIHIIKHITNLTWNSQKRLNLLYVYTHWNDHISVRPSHCSIIQLYIGQACSR